MKLKSFNYFIGLIIILFNLPVIGEEKIDIWKNKKEKIVVESPNTEIKKEQKI